MGHTVCQCLSREGGIHCRQHRSRSFSRTRIQKEKHKRIVHSGVSPPCVPKNKNFNFYMYLKINFKIFGCIIRNKSHVRFDTNLLPQIPNCELSTFFVVLMLPIPHQRLSENLWPYSITNKSETTGAVFR